METDAGKTGTEETGSSLGHFPAEARWKFDESVTRIFDDMIRRSIPDLDSMRRLVVDIAEAYRIDSTTIVDLGASRGDAVAPLVTKYGGMNRFALVEVAPAMVDVLEERFVEARSVTVYRQDLRNIYPPVRDVSVTVCVLTLQFTPIEYRLQILRSAFRSMVPGGAFILVEKVLGSTADANDLLVRLYHQRKAEAGYTQEEIDRKRLSLEGVLVPVTEKWNEDLLRSAGFNGVECFWRCLNFAGWLAVKP